MKQFLLFLCFTNAPFGLQPCQLHRDDKWEILSVASDSHRAGEDIYKDSIIVSPYELEKFREYVLLRFK